MSAQRKCIDHESIALLSIHPNYSELIRRGIKRVEFRRRSFTRDVKHLVLYSTAPVQQIVGFCEVEYVDVDEPSALWLKYKDISGIARETLLRYLSGLTASMAIIIKDNSFTTLQPPLSLSDIGLNRAPQSFQYLSDRVIHFLA